MIAYYTKRKKHKQKISNSAIKDRENDHGRKRRTQRASTKGVLAGFQGGRLAPRHRRPRLHHPQRDALWATKFLVGSTARTKAVWAKLQPYFEAERKKGVLAVDAKSLNLLRKGRLYRSRQRGDRRSADRPTVQAGNLSVRRPAHGRDRGSRRPASRPIRGSRDLHQIPQDRTTTACSTPTRPKSCGAASRRSSPVCLTPTAAAASSATTDGSRCTASTVCSKPSAPNAPRSTTCGQPTK